MRALRREATSGRDDHGQGKSQGALQHSWGYSSHGEVRVGERSVRRTNSWRDAFPHSALCLALCSLVLVLTTLGGRLYAQAPAAGSAPAPAVPDPLEPLPLFQERLLAPIPQPFNWLEREAPANPFLEALLNLQEPAHLLVSASLTEEVSDNFTHSPSSRRVDSRTGVALSTVYRLDTERSFVSLANTVRGFYQARTERTQLGFANLILNAGYESPPWSFGLTDTFVRSDGATAQSVTAQSVTAQSVTPLVLNTQRTFIRNSVSPQVRYSITPRSSVAFRYTNTVVVDEEDSQGNATSHAATLSLHHRFSPNLTGSTAYTVTTSQGAGASGGYTQRLNARAGYSLNPDTSFNLSAFSTFVERSGAAAQDSRTYGATLGARRVLFANVSLAAAIGPTVFQREGEASRVRASWSVSLDGPIPIFATPALTLTLVTSQNVHDTVGEVNDVGLVLRQVVAARLMYTPSAFLTGRLFAEYSRNELLEDTGTVGAARGRTDNLWSTGVTASYALTRSISLTGLYRYQRRDSTRAGNDFEENRVTLIVTGRLSIF